MSVGMPIGNDRVTALAEGDAFERPTEVGWYGVISGDGEGEVWVGAAHWDGKQWSSGMGLAYARSAHPFEHKDEALGWAYVQPD